MNVLFARFGYFFSRLGNPLGYAPTNSKFRNHRIGWLVVGGILIMTALPGWAQIDVTSTAPRQNTNRAARDASPTVYFRTLNGVVDNTSLSNFRVFSAQYGGSKAGTKLVNTNQLIFNPSQNFKPGEVVRVSVPSSISVLENGTKRAVEPHVFQFTTAATSAPAVFNGSALIEANQPNVHKLAAADLNGDATLDIISVGNAIRTHIRQPNGTYTNQQLANQGALALQPADMDGDGDLDVVILYYGPGTLGEVRNPGAQPVGELMASIFYNLGNGNFEANAQTIDLGPARSDGPSGLTIADMNEDGRLDIITTRYLNVVRYRTDDYSNYTQYENRVQINFSSTTSTRNFTALAWQADLNSGGDVEGVEAADLDGDGDLDLLLTHRNNNNVATFRNDGTGRAYSRGADAPMQADPTKPVLADMDGDGDLDVVAANRGANTVSIRYNSGNGGIHTSFQTDLTVGQKPTQVAVGDVDGDGDLDILTANRESNTVSIRLNMGNGTYSATADIAVNIGRSPADPADLVVADLDDDGDLDFVTTVSGANGLLIRYNDDSPFLPTITSISPPGGVEGDTLLISGTNFSGLSGFRLNGIALGKDSIWYVSPTQVKIIVPSGNVYGPVQVTTQNGTSTTSINFQPPITVTSLFPKRNALNVPRSTPVKLTYDKAVGASSRVEVFSFQAGGRKTVSFHLDNNGNGSLIIDLIPQSVSGNTLTTPAMSFKPGEVVQVIAPRQTRGTDGRSIRPQVYQFTVATGGTGRGNFKPGIDVPVAESNYCGICTNKGYYGPRRFGLVLADLDYGGHDGKLDIMMPLFMRDVTIAYSPLFVNDGNGVSFTDPESGAHNAPYRLPLLKTDGSWAFQPDAEGLPTPYFLGTVAADLFRGGIGQLNVASTFNRSTASVLVSSLLHNIGPDQYSRISLTQSIPDLKNPYFSDYTFRSGPTSVEAADLNGDADLDLVLGHDVLWYGHPYVSTVINDANLPEDAPYFITETRNTTFRQGPKLDLGGKNYKAKSADMNGDGTLDIITADYGLTSNGGVIIRLNTGNGTNFTAVPDVAVANKPFDLEVADMDGDGDLDILTTSDTEKKVSIRLNNGDGTFTGGSDLSFTAKPWDLATGDIDADGDLDIVVVKDDNFVSVRFNDGQGTFSGTTEVAVGTGPYSIALGDMDDDGDLDIVTANDNSFSVRLNEAFTDLTPTLYARPGTVRGTTTISVVVDVVELGGMASSGPITLKISKDALLSLSFNSSLTSLSSRPVQNSVWSFSGPAAGFYTLTTNQVVAAGEKLSVGLSGVISSGATAGNFSVSAVIVGSSGGEVRTANNADAEKIDYFQQ